jgi:hypothetical protein
MNRLKNFHAEFLADDFNLCFHSFRNHFASCLQTWSISKYNKRVEGKPSQKDFKNFYISTANYKLIHAGNAYNKDRLEKKILLDEVGRGACRSLKCLCGTLENVWALISVLF